MQTEDIDSRLNAGYSLTEVMVASGIGAVVLTALLAAFTWTTRAAHVARQSVWAQSEVRMSAQKVVSYVRTACEITAIDQAGTWVELEMPSSVTSRLAYVNPTEQQGMGQLLFVGDVSNTNAATNIVAKGLTEVMTLPPRNVFHQTGPDTLRIAYRVTKPASPGDAPSEIDVGVHLRNH